MIAAVRFVSNVANVFAKDTLSVLLVTDRSSLCHGGGFPMSNAWCVGGFAGFHAFCLGTAAAGGVIKSSFPSVNPNISKYGLLVCDFDSVLGL